jgi:putative transport protein
MACGVVLTVVPLLAVAVVVCAALGLNYLTLCGFLAGSMTDPPVFFFATAVSGSEALPGLRHRLP